jgi:hypothetical protein
VRALFENILILTLAILLVRNHVLKALFPLITTDLLTPFIDLLEDALLTQVPPVIVSDY